MTEIPVKAACQIEMKGGMVIARQGDAGRAIAGFKPNRPQHYGLVPVRWRNGSRAFWVTEDQLISRSSLQKCITPAPEPEIRIMVPKEAKSEFSFGQNLRQFRRARRLSQVQLAESMGRAGLKRISQSSISNWEKRSYCPSGKFLKAAAQALDVPVYAFFVNLDCFDVDQTIKYIKDLRKILCKR